VSVFITRIGHTSGATANIPAPTVGPAAGVEVVSVAGGAAFERTVKDP
jgi:hypothetical protein